MKKNILFILLFVAVMAKGQTAALCIDNSANPCIVNVIMHAQDASTTPADGPCAT